MDNPNADETKDLIIPDADATHGLGSSLDIGHIKSVLAVKMEKHTSHYTNITPLGKGSFGEVHSATDALLGREVAIKSLKEHFRNEEDVIDRFLKEARGTSQLEHPNIMPVHEMGVSEELGIYFTMKKIEGDNLKEILDYLESGTSLYLKKYPLNVLLEIFLAVCNGVAFAHSKGVIHRDLKPANIMIGEFGEVLILDWGLVKKLDSDEKEAPGNVKLRMDEFDVGSKTMDGAVSGTPNYMAPEQAEGRINDIDFQSDIYSLGAILYHILTYLPPFEKTQLRQLLENVKKGNFEAPRKRRPELKIPKELNAISLKAMSLFPINRYRSVERLAQDIRNYISHRDVLAYKAPRHIRFWNSCKRNPIKSSVAVAVLLACVVVVGIQQGVLYRAYKMEVKAANKNAVIAGNLIPVAKTLYKDLEEIRAEATTKQPLQQEEDLKSRLDEEFRKIRKFYEYALNDLAAVPQKYRKKTSVVRAYSNIFSNQIAYALYCQNYSDATNVLITVDERLKGWKKPPDDKITAQVEEARKTVAGNGSLLITEAPGVAMAELVPLLDDAPDEFNNGKIDPRMRNGDPLRRGREFPFSSGSIPKGSYLLFVELEDGSRIPYPVYISHGENKEMQLVVPDGGIPDDMAYVPQGEFFYGGEDSRFFRKHTVNLPGFFIKKYEVTFAEYLEFWKSLKSADLKARYMSRIRFSYDERKFYDAWNASGKLQHEEQGMLPEFPVVGITLDAAKAYCEWLTATTGKPCRIPTAQEWEKAARGVDGRRYPWGNFYQDDARLALIKRPPEMPQNPPWAKPGSFPRDTTVYNGFDMGGNVREMTVTELPGSDKLFMVKGGSGSTPPTFLPCCYASDTPVVPSDVGFRYVMDLPNPAEPEPSKF